ncbi:hypothetical protein TELCIR_15435, partial [Teladorsagia circumcincta]
MDGAHRQGPLTGGHCALTLIGAKAREIGEGVKLYYNGEGTKRNGVAITVAGLLKDHVSAVNRVSDRIMAVSIDTKNGYWTILSVYAPQAGCPESEKDESISALAMPSDRFQKGTTSPYQAEIKGQKCHMNDKNEKTCQDSKASHPNSFKHEESESSNKNMNKGMKNASNGSTRFDTAEANCCEGSYMCSAAPLRPGNSTPDDNCQMQSTTMLLDSPLPTQTTFLCDSPVRAEKYQAKFSTTRMTRIPRRRSSGIYPPGFRVMRPRLVTGTSKPPDYIEKSSSIYCYSKEKTYFEQCFKIVRQLGKGAFGEALEVESLEDGKRSAIKRALHTFESSGDRRQKLREAI